MFDSNDSIVNGMRGDVNILEKERDVKMFRADENETVDDAKARMQRNLEMILNVDRYAEASKSYATQVEEKPVENVVTSEVVEDKIAMEPVVIDEPNEDQKPSQTTLQFGSNEGESLLNDFRFREISSTESAVEQKASKKTKLTVAIYSIAVTIILALIILNTGILAAVGKSNEVKREELAALSTEYNQIMEDVQNISTDGYISDVAENELGMIK